MNLFLSYKSQNREFVRSISERLTSYGYTVFFDQNNLQIGGQWLKEIEQGIDQSEAAFIFIGEYGIGEWQNKEILKIIERKNTNNTTKDEYKIIPVVIPGNTKPMYNLPWYLSDYQWVELKGQNDNFGFDKLLSVLNINSIPYHNVKPYKGLSSFDVKDNDIFYGRNNDLFAVFNQFLRLNYNFKENNFLAIIADSGAGKSSFAKAGILAAIKNNQFEDSSLWKQIIIKPGINPLMSLSAALEREGIIQSSSDFDKCALENDDQFLRKLLVYDDYLVLYVDQFEEVLQQAINEQLRRAFLANLSKAVEFEKLVVIVSMRSDFYAQFASYDFFKSILEKNNYILPVFDLEKIGDKDQQNWLFRSIIEKPARKANVDVARNLSDTLINDLVGVKGSLPMIQFAMEKLWDAKNSHKEITLEDYAKVTDGGNLDTLIEKHAEEVFKVITRQEADKKRVSIIKKLFTIHLTEVTESQNDVRKIARFEEIINNTMLEDKVIVKEIVHALSSEKARILSLSSQNLTGNDIKVEVLHEVIIRKWPRLRSWIAERREALVFKSRLERDIVDYNNGNGELYSGRKLIAAINWLKTNTDLTNKDVADFLLQSQIIKKRTSIISKFLISAFAILILVISSYLYYINSDYKFKKDILLNEDVQIRQILEKVGGDLSLIKKIEITRNNFNLLNKNLNRFKKLDTLIFTGIDSPFDNQLEIPKSIKHLIATYCSDKNILNKIIHLEQLISLEISSSNWSQINFGKLVNLKSLKLEYDENITNLINLNSLVNLESLEVVGLNKVSNINLSKLKKISSLKTDVDILNIEGFSNLVNLEKLEILFIEDTIINVTNFTKLKSLEIYSDQLNEIKGLNKVINLEKLIIQCQGLKKLDIKSLKNLKELSLNDLDKIDLFKMISNQTLNTLILINSHITEIELNNFKNLRRIEIQGDQNLKKIFGSENLRELIIENTDSEFLEIYNLNNLSEVVIINCSYLKKIILPNKIIKLEISGTDLRELNLTKFTNLHILKIKDKLTNFQGIQHLKNLKHAEIVIPNNYRTLDFSNNQSLDTLNIYGYELDSIIGLSKIFNLKKLIINISKISTIDLTNIKSLISLTVSSRKLNAIKGIESLYNLVRLEVESNNSRIKKLDISKYFKLKYLNISIDSLTQIDGISELKELDSLVLNAPNLNINHFGQMRTLKYLFIINNNVEEISNWDNLSELESIEITGNRLHRLDVTQLYHLKLITIRSEKLEEIVGLKSINKLKLDCYNNTILFKNLNLKKCSNLDYIYTNNDFIKLVNLNVGNRKVKLIYEPLGIF